MSRYVFVPLSDELLYDHPERITGPIVPYHPDAPCYHWLSVEINPEDDIPPKTRPATTRPSAAVRYLVGANKIPRRLFSS